MFVCIFFVDLSAKSSQGYHGILGLISWMSQHESSCLGTVSATFLVLMLLQQRRSELILRNLPRLREAALAMAAEFFTCTDDFLLENMLKCSPFADG